MTSGEANSVAADRWPWRWCLYWLVLPNILPIVMWPVGGPPMGRTIIVVGALGLVLSQLPSRALRRVAMALLMLGGTFEYVISSFNLELMRFDAISEFVRHANPMASMEYLIGAAIFLGAVAIAVNGAGRASRFRITSHWIIGMAATLALAQADTLATAATSNTYKGLPPAGTPFHSAVKAARAEAPDAQKHNVVLILVEALGIPTFARGHELFEQDWNRPEWRKRYQVSSGRIAYFGSTTNGELRELCGTFSNFDDYDFAHHECMPGRFAHAGYDTLAIHAFDGAFFDRQAWWPRAGFKETLFDKQLKAGGARACGGMWPGACDVDVAKLIGMRLKHADKPQFVYWVTLNTHIPVLDGATPGLGGCVNGTAPLADMSLMRCRLFEAYRDIANAISALAMDPDLPPTDFIIVGDHMPPFMSRSERLAFDGYSVPWIYLKSKSADAAK